MPFILCVYAYLTARSTNSRSSLPTSRLNASLSAQQSRGLLSFIRKHCTSSSLAFSTPGSGCSSFFLLSSFFFSSSISLETLLRLNCAFFCDSAASPVSFSTSEGEDPAESTSDETFSAMDSSLAASSFANRSSSEVTRVWILSSRLASLVLSD